MQLEGIHHITGFTSDAQRNVDFYVDVLGLRFVKKSVNQDNTSVYHLFFADEEGHPGCDITFFEYPQMPRGRAGRGMVHRIVWRVGSSEAIDFWELRLTHGASDPTRLDAHTLRFSDPEGLEHELTVTDTTDAPLTARHPEIPQELAIQGFDSARAYAADPRQSEPLLATTLGFTAQTESNWESRGAERGGRWFYDPPPEARGLQGAGTIHHIAWASHPDDQEGWQRRVAEAGAHPTPIIDRHYFRSIYFREPSGVLFEIATIGPGYTVDEPLEQLGEKLSLTPKYEHLRAEIEPTLTPIHNPRDDWAAR